LLEPLVIIELVFLEILNGLFRKVLEQEASQIETMTGYLPGLKEGEKAVGQMLSEIEFLLRWIDQEDGVVGLDTSTWLQRLFENPNNAVNMLCIRPPLRGLAR
jgi:hypothetical protein